MHGLPDPFFGSSEGDSVKIGRSNCGVRRAAVGGSSIAPSAIISANIGKGVSSSNDKRNSKQNAEYHPILPLLSGIEALDIDVNMSDGVSVENREDPGSNSDFERKDGGKIGKEDKDNTENPISQKVNSSVGAMGNKITGPDKNGQRDDGVGSKRQKPGAVKRALHSLAHGVARTLVGKEWATRGELPHEAILGEERRMRFLLVGDRGCGKTALVT